MYHLHSSWYLTDPLSTVVRLVALRFRRAISGLTA